MSMKIRHSVLSREFQYLKGKSKLVNLQMIPTCCVSTSSVEKGLQIAVDFGEISGLRLNLEKTKAMWLGKWSGNKSKPLRLKWVSSPTRILGIYFSYDEKGNNEMNFNLKIDKLQTNLDIWKSRDLTLFGKVMIIKALGVSSLTYSASNINDGSKRYCK